MAQLGARVVKVEQPECGDPARDWGPPFREDTAVLFGALNRDKQGITVQLKDPAERDALRCYIKEHADVVIQNLRPGSIERLGLSGDQLTREHPSLIYCNLSAFGNTGPLKLKPGYDPLMQAYGGLMSITGEPGSPPVRVGTSIIDMGAGMWSVIAILAALHERERTGRGGVVDTSLYETALAWMTLPLATYLESGEIPQPLGSGAPQIVPYQIFSTADGHLMVAAGSDKLFEQVAVVLGRPEWSKDERFSTNSRRVVNREILIPDIQQIMLAKPTYWWVERLEASSIPNACVQTVDAVACDAQTIALGIIQHVGKGRQLLGLPVSFDGQRPPFRSPPPRLGEDNRLLSPVTLGE